MAASRYTSVVNFDFLVSVWFNNYNEMKAPASLPGEFIRDFDANPKGLVLLDGSVPIQEAVTGYCTATSQPERRLKTGTYVGMGDKSELWAIDGVVLKANSGTTGKHAWRFSSFSDTGSSEDLIGQFRYMNALGDHFNSRPDSEIIVPEHFFALKTGIGAQLLGQQQMTDWISLYAWGIEARIPNDKWNVLSHTMKDRMLELLGRSGLNMGLRLGLADMGLSGREPLHSKNVLVPKDTDDPLASKLCIIDQPSRGIRGKIGTLAASINSHSDKAA